MTTPSVALCVSCALIASASASANFTGYSVDRAITTAGNTQYKVYANFSAANLVFLGAFNWQILGGALNARHQDAAEDADGNPSQSWSASANLLGSVARDNDSWVTASGSGTAAGNDAALDPGFNPSNGSSIPNGAGWFDATPGTANLIGAGGASGYRMLIMQIVRTGNDCQGGNSDIVFSLQVSYRVTGSNTTVGQGNLVIPCPAPGAMALLCCAGCVRGRKR